MGGAERRICFREAESGSLMLWLSEGKGVAGRATMAFTIMNCEDWDERGWTQPSLGLEVANGPALGSVERKGLTGGPTG